MSPGDVAFVIPPVDFEQTEMLQNAKLIVGDASVLVVLVHLRFGEAEHKIGRARVADHAFGAAGIMPGLFAGLAKGPLTPALSPWRGEGEDKFLIQAFGVDEQGAGLLIVPDVAVADPFLLLASEQACLDAFARRGAALLGFEGKRFHEDGTFGKGPAAVVGELDFAITWNGNEAFLECAVGPKRRVD